MAITWRYNVVIPFVQSVMPAIRNMLEISELAFIAKKVNQRILLRLNNYQSHRKEEFSCDDN